MAQPDIIQQLKYHSLVLEALPKWKELTDAGKKKEADELASQILEWERLYVEYGGQGPIT